MSTKREKEMMDTKRAPSHKFEPIRQFRLYSKAVQHERAGYESFAVEQSVTFKAGKTEPRHKKQFKKLEDRQLIQDEVIIPPGDKFAVFVVEGADANSAALAQSASPLVLPRELPFQGHIYLFNVVVALEWQPTDYDTIQLQAAFQSASDFLFDVTDGFMAFGQVIIGGMELMECADIQIMASNRFNPRSWVNGLHEPEKYMPIRVGRGIWRKNRRMSIPWDEPEGYRTLIHEWAHYALGLRDEYLSTIQVALIKDAYATRQSGSILLKAPYTLVVPSISIASESIMATLEGTSELVPRREGSSRQHKQQTWETLAKCYPQVGPEPPGLIGPHRLPIALPNFPVEGAPNQQNLLHRDGDLLLHVPTTIIAEHCWVYVVKGELQNPTQIVAQGTFDALATTDGFRLLNAKPNDYVVLIGTDRQGHPAVLQARIDVAGSQQNGTQPGVALDWQPATPASFPLVDVIPSAVPQDEPNAQIQVRITGTTPPDQVWLFPLGQKLNDHLLTPDGDETWACAQDQITMLDGHVMLRWSTGELLICTYSQGGGPATHVAALQSPITAGSSDGNVMIFFNDPELKPVKDAEPKRQYSAIRVVTTLLHGMPQTLPDRQAEARSYTFSITSNAALPAKLTPTLIMYFDTRALRAGGDLLIHRRVGHETWLAMPTYLPPDSSFAAMPIDQDTAPSLLDEHTERRIEHYRLYWQPW